MDKDELIYSIEITNGYAFRQIFELFIKLIIQNIFIFLKEDIITFRAGTGSKSGRKLISNIEINTDDIIDYRFNEKLADIKETEDSPSIILEQFNINDVGNNFKSIAKTNSVRLFKKEGSKRVGIETKGLVTDISWIDCAKYQTIEYDLSGFKDIPDNPNIRIEINQFSSIMKGMTKGDPEYISFKVYPKGLVVESWNSSGKEPMRNGNWGNIKGDKYYETTVNNQVIKALCKINSMAIYSIIKIYSSRKGYLKLSHKIGDFGNHEIFLIDKNEEEED